ncbi:MAG: hypothetical protein AMS18_10160 [Gemmatimonas sp. SG8_17]|nr:MAG: hypothetical protein AMS18_10160 [Gemmatimonas sp. SG8_17]
MPDVLRGVAVCGILLANILIFAFPADSANLIAESSRTGDQLVGVFQGLFVEGKFYSLFSILFGAGIALQSRRAQSSNQPFTKVYVRRLIVLVLIGIVHGLLFFSADILAFYAVVAFIVLPFRKARPTALLSAAIVCHVIGLLVLGAYAYRSDGNPVPQEPSWRTLVASRQPARHDAWLVVMPRVAKLLRVSELDLYEFMADEQRIFAEGTWLEMVRHRAVRFSLIAMPLKLAFVSWRVLALFLLGMYFVRTSLNIDRTAETTVYRRTAISFFTLGMILQLVGAVAQANVGQYMLALPVFLIGVFTGVVAVSLGYAAWILTLCTRKAKSALVHALAAVGRMALTNYLGQSIICGSIFYGYGLGLFGQLHATEVMMLTVPIFALQLVVSSVWLRYFQFGPVEWIWRTLSYLQVQPMRRPL